MRARPSPSATMERRSAAGRLAASALTTASAMPGTAFVAAPPVNAITTRSASGMGLLENEPL